MSWSQHLRNPTDFHKPGDEVEAVILAIDKEERKMSLGTKQLTPDPWINIADRYPVGSKHTGFVRNLTNYGLFVELGEGVDGLVHVSDLSWTKKINHPAEFIKKDEKIDVVVLEIDVENRRLSLGHKQLEENPWDTFESIFFTDSIHSGVVTGIEDKGAIVQMAYGIEAFCPKKQMMKEDNKSLQMEEQADFMVIELSKENRRIVVSHTRLWKDKKDAEKATETKQATEDVKKVNAKAKKDQSEKSTLGEHDVLAGLKEQILASEQKAQQDAIKKMDEKMKKSDD
jgi:small subunit ribosomal protein S1